MITLRQKIENFIYPFLEKFTSLVYKGGEDTVFRGIRLLDDESNFTQGALVNAAAVLFCRYKKTGDARADEVAERLHYFMELAAKSECKTWGKIAILRAFVTLKNANLIQSVRPELVAALKERTNYEDFFDKSTLKLIGKAENYYHVAMACAGMRELIGWESGGFADKIKDVFLSSIAATSAGGWLDDAPPHGRYDRYSFVFSSEIRDTLSAIGLPTPKLVRDNLTSAKNIILFLANKKGDGFSWGRTIACHGDETGLEVLSSAFAEGVVDEDETDAALEYCSLILDKLFGFWYDEAAGAFNMWWHGRDTNSYRPVERLLETNLDLANHLYMALKNFEAAGVADREIKAASIKARPNLEFLKVPFRRREGDEKCFYAFREGSTLMMIPFVGHGDGWCLHPSYSAVPTIAGALQPSTEGLYPFMLPEYTDDAGNKYRPYQFFDSVCETESHGVVKICATGYLNKCGEKPQRSDARFTLCFTVSGDGVKMSIRLDKKMRSAAMVTGAHGTRVKFSTFGFDESAPFYIDGGAPTSPEGYLENALIHTKSAPNELGYEITF